MKSAGFLLALVALVVAADVAPAQRGNNVNVAVNGGNGASAIVQASGRGRRNNVNIAINNGNGAAQIRDRRNNLLLVQNNRPANLIVAGNGHRGAAAIVASARPSNVLLIRDGHHFNNAAAIIASARYTAPSRIVAVRDFTAGQQEFLLRLEDGSLCPH